MNACNEERLSRHVDHELEPADARELVEHMKTCAGCRETFARLKEFHGIAVEAFPVMAFAAPKPPVRSRRHLAVLAAAAILILMLGGLGTSAMKDWFGGGGSDEELAGNEPGRTPVETGTADPSDEEVGAGSDAPRTSVFDTGVVRGTSRERRGRTAPKPSGIRLAGVIQNFDDEPVAHATVVTVEYKRGNMGENTLAKVDSTVTDAEGRYDLPYPPQGSALHVYADGYAPAAINVGKPIDVPEQSLDIKLFRPHTVFGRAVDVHGQPIAGATVRRRNQSYLEEYAPYAVTDREGRYAVSLFLAYGALEVMHAGYAAATTGVRMDGIAEDAVLHTRGALRVRVTREHGPIEDVRIAVKALGDGGTRIYGRTDDQGVAFLEGLPTNTPLSVTASSVYRSASADLLEVPEGGTAEVTIRLRTPRPQAAEVTNNAGGAPVAGGAGGRPRRDVVDYPTLALLNDAGEPLTRALLESGITPQGQGSSFWIGDSEEPLELSGGRYHFNVYDPVTEMAAVVSDASRLTTESVVLDTPMGRITGRVIDRNGLPLAHVYVQASNAEGGEVPFWRREVQSDANGNFELGPLTVGIRHSLRPMLPGYQLVPGAERPMAEPSRHANPITITMAKVESEISGYVVALDGTGVPDAGVSLMAGRQHIDSQKTDASGAFRFQVASGEYEIQARARNEINSPEDSYVIAPMRGVIVALPLHTGSPEGEGAPTGPEHELASNMLKQMGVVFKMFANESRGAKYPALSTEYGAFEPVVDDLYPEYITDSTVLARVTGGDKVKWVYLGYAVNDSQTGAAILDAYETLGPEAMSGNDIEVGEELGAGGNVFQLREGIERFYITDINNPAASANAQSTIPLTWEMPGGHEESGGWVLYMDGHVEWKGYPGDFPMNPAFIERIRGIMDSRK